MNLKRSIILEPYAVDQATHVKTHVFSNCFIQKKLTLKSDYLFFKWYSCIWKWHRKTFMSITICETAILS